MPIDSDPITVSSKRPDDFTSMMIDITSNVQWKMLGFMLIIFLFVSSDVFINRALAQFNGAVDYKCPTSYGTVLQGLFLVLSCVLIDTAIRQKII